MDPRPRPEPARDAKVVSEVADDDGRRTACQGFPGPGTSQGRSGEAGPTARDALGVLGSGGHPRVAVPGRRIAALGRYSGFLPLLPVRKALYARAR